MGRFSWMTSVFSNVPVSRGELIKWRRKCDNQSHRDKFDSVSTNVKGINVLCKLEISSERPLTVDPSFM